MMLQTISEHVETLNLDFLARLISDTEAEPAWPALSQFMQVSVPFQFIP